MEDRYGDISDSRVIGIVGVGVGMLTGAEYTRIYSVLDDQYHIDMWLNYFAEVAAAVQAA